jgi:hypothetical protein
MMLFLQIFGWVSLIGAIGAFALMTAAFVKSAGLVARRRALEEAAEALQSLADIAEDAMEIYLDEGRVIEAEGSSIRHYHYGRAAQIVRSIPVDRL